MELATIGQWQFDMPEGWLRKDSESVDYFEEPGGTKGLYVKSIVLPQPKGSPSALAEYIQSVHLKGFNEASGANWSVMERAIKEQHGLVRSVLDIYDAQASYRVLSFVVCGTQQAIQVSVHDYACTDYSATRNAFTPLASSIHNTQPMV
ncbi:MAG TPA: hypothetical protein VFW60_01065 [Rhodanobacteraceae bacterium]|nr:hypothetical protein [Rhodanobacteraceae bacterium]